MSFTCTADDGIQELIVPTEEWEKHMLNWVPQSDAALSNPVIALGSCKYPPLSFEMKKINMGFDVKEETFLVSLFENDVGIVVFVFEISEALDFVKNGNFGEYEEQVKKFGLYEVNTILKITIL